MDRQDLPLKRRWILPAAAIAIFLAPLVPELAGWRLLCFRDSFVTHFPVKLAAWAALRRGHVPFVGFGFSNGEPLLGDPNYAMLYPTNWLYLILPPVAAFNLHLLLHVVWAFLGAAQAARLLGVRSNRSWLAGAGYAFSGPFLSYAAAFTNSVAAAAWAPWVLAAALLAAKRSAEGWRAASRPALAAGIALGLQFLAGEPAIVLWTAALTAPLALIASPVRRRTAGALALSAFSAGLLAAPQILVTRQILPLSFRGEHLFSKEQFGASANVPLRLLENFFPLVYGAPKPMVSGAFWAYDPFLSAQPYLYSANLGLTLLLLAGLALATRRLRRQPIVAALAGAGALAWLLSLGWRTPLFAVLYAFPQLRHLRYPVKLLLPASLALALLAAMALEDGAIERHQRVFRRLAIAAGAVLAAGMGAALWLGDSLEKILAPQFSRLLFSPQQMLPGIFRTIVWDASFGLAALAITAYAARRDGGGAAALHLAAVLLCLLPSGWRLFVSEPAVDALARPPLAARVAGRGRLWVSGIGEFAVARFGTKHDFETDDIVPLIAAGQQELWPGTGLPYGVRYAFDGDPDGSYGYLDRIMSEAMDARSPYARAQILRSCSTRFVLSDSRKALPGFRRVARQTLRGRQIVLDEAVAPVPLVRLSERVFSRSSLSAAVGVFEQPDFDPARDVVVPGLDRDPGPPSEEPPGKIRWRSDGARFEAEAAARVPATVVFALTDFGYWRASVDGAPAPIEIANGNLCGIRVPAGRHVVRLWYDEGPFRLGAALCFAFLLVAAAVLTRRARRRSPLSPESPS